MLIVKAGLPGSGKSAVAGQLARELGCALLSVDPVEAAMWRAGIGRDQPTGLAAYVVAEDLAREQLVIGNDVIVDAVNDVDAARGQWRSLAARCDRRLAFLEVFCSDEHVHRERLRSRVRGTEGFLEPTWESVVERRSGFSRWDDTRVRIDSVRPLEESVEMALEYLGRERRSR
jgi:predicted kinase